METNDLLTSARKVYANAVNERLLKADQERYGYIRKLCEHIRQHLACDIMEAASTGETGVRYFVEPGALYDVNDMLLAVQKLAPGFNVNVRANDDFGNGSGGCVYISFDP